MISKDVFKMYVTRYFLWFLFISYQPSHVNSVVNFIDKTDKVFNTPGGLDGIVAAYGDSNMDKITDVFGILQKQNITLLYGSNDDINLKQKHSIHLSKNIDSIAPGDFNGDGLLDLMVTFSSNANVIFSIVWGTKNGVFGSVYKSPVPLITQPLLMDVNGDMIVDLFVVFPNQTRQFWIGHSSPPSSDWKFLVCDFHVDQSKTFIPGKIKNKYSHAFLDFFGNGHSNLVVRSYNGYNCSFEIWQGSVNGLRLVQLQKTFQLKTDKVEFGHSAFFDLDNDGLQDHLLPVCDLEDGRCNNSRIYFYNYKQKVWSIVYITKEWNFIPNSVSGEVLQPMKLIAGNYNKDIYVDVLCLMEIKKKPQAVMLYGADCNVDYCKDVGQMFEYAFTITTSDPAVTASFYDLASDGSSDILVSVRSNNKLKTRAFQNAVAEDVSFLMVKILPGLPVVTESNVYGGCVKYQTTNTKGGVQISSSCQLYQSSHFALQLPYVSFGLGRLPNFVDKLIVTIPSPMLKCHSAMSELNFKPRHGTWTMIIPNSQLFILPYPLQQPDSWTNRMIVYPSKNVVITGIVLLGTCVIVSIIAVTLHCIEKKNDILEKKRDAHKFHFDAM